MNETLNGAFCSL